MFTQVSTLCTSYELNKNNLFSSLVKEMKPQMPFFFYEGCMHTFLSDQVNVNNIILRFTYQVNEMMLKSVFPVI